MADRDLLRVLAVGIRDRTGDFSRKLLVEEELCQVDGPEGRP